VFSNKKLVQSFFQDIRALKLKLNRVLAIFIVDTYEWKNKKDAYV